MSWHTVLAQLEQPPASSGLQPLIDNIPSGLIYPLTGFACLAVTGPERFTFLQGQVTCDMRRVEQGESLLGAHLNLQGRIEASFILLPQADRIVILLPASQRDHLRALLAKYILFAKADIVEDDAALPFLLWTDATEPPQDSYELVQSLGVVLAITDAQGAESLVTEYRVGAEPEALAILHRNGLYLVEQPQRGVFLPQELNYEQIDGVSFNKGCYKGQEVVARIHFKGQVKQRLTGFYCNAQAATDTTVVDDNGKKCGTLVHVTPLDADCIGIVLLRVSDRESRRICLEQNDGPQLRLLPPPYAIT